PLRQSPSRPRSLRATPGGRSSIGFKNCGRSAATIPIKSKPPPPKPKPPPVGEGYASRRSIVRRRNLSGLGSNNPNAAEAASARERVLALMAANNISAGDLGPPPSVEELDPAEWDA